MKIIEGLKKVQDLQRKAEDIRTLVGANCAVSNLETPKYDDQKTQVSEWIQAHTDVLKEILRLRIAIQKTNLETLVTIDLGGVHVEKSIAAWIHRRRDLANEDLNMWKKLTDRGIQEGVGKGPTGDPMEIKILRFYDPVERDNHKELYASEPSTIDGRLEVVNATTDLIE